MRTIVHVHQQVIALNRKHGRNDPPLTVKTFASEARHAKPVSARKAHTARVTGPCRIVHSPHEPLPCGARVWIETNSEVICDEEGSAVEGGSRQVCDQVCESDGQTSGEV